MKRIRCRNCTHGLKQHCKIYVVMTGTYNYIYCMKPNCKCDEFKGVE